MKLLAVAAAAFAISGGANAYSLPEEVRYVQQLAKDSPAELVQHIQESPLAAVFEGYQPSASEAFTPYSGASSVPTVVAHGMGDSCFNPGMKQITEDIGTHMGSYSVCIPTGNSQIMDTINGFLMTMDKSIDVFAQKIKADPKLANGFNALGLSQGNSLIRGYIQKYNDPPVKKVIHVHGTVSGVAGFPQCNPSGKLLGPVCRALSAIIGDLAYNPLVQGILFQADYFRHPAHVNSTWYKKYSQLAQLNNEGDTVTAEYKTNFAKVEKLTMVKAKGDTMVFPNDGEWWGLYEKDMKTIDQMKDTSLYKNDNFGLKTVDEAGKIFYETTDGNHLQFTIEQLHGWLNKYWQ